MKKVLITLSILATMCLCANAQSDAFFSYNTPSDGYRVERGEVMPLLPLRGADVIDDNQGAIAPLGSGWLLLAGMGVAYALRKKKNE